MPRVGRTTALARAAALAILGAMSLLIAGCGATVRSAAYEGPHIAVPIAVDETLRSLEDPVTRERVARVLATPEMQRAVREVAAAAMDEALAKSSSEEANARLDEVVGRVTAAFSRALLEVLRGELAGEIGSPEYVAAERRIERDLSNAVAGATRSALRTAADEIPETVGPSVRKALVTELQSPELRAALAVTVAEITRQALLTSRDVIVELHREAAEAGKPSMFPVLGQMVTLAWSATLVLAAALLILLAWALQMRRRTKRFRAAVFGILAREDKQVIGAENLQELLHALAH
jgi:hypothetical protein